MREYLAFGLRLINGANIKLFENKFDTSIEIFSKEIDKLTSLELIVNNDVRLTPTVKGLDLWNKVFMTLLD